MKKYWVVLMAVILLVCTSSICMAEVDLGQDNFEFWAQCTNASTTDLNYDDSCVVKKTGGNSSYMYVKHWVYDGSEEYTNYFRMWAIRGTTPTTYVGQKWATVGISCPIAGSWNTSYTYNTAGRGNTNHYDYDGNYRVSLHGWVYGNL